MLNNLQNYITLLSKFLTTTFFILLILTVLLQVFSRFFLVQAPPWTEELSRFFLYILLVFHVVFVYKKILIFLSILLLKNFQTKINF